MKKGLVFLVLAVLFTACASTPEVTSHIDMDNLLPLDQTCTLELQAGLIITKFNGDPDTFNPNDFRGTTVITRVPAGRCNFTVRYIVKLRNIGGINADYPEIKSFTYEFLPGHTYRIYKPHNLTVNIKDMGVR